MQTTTPLGTTITLDEPTGYVYIVHPDVADGREIAIGQIIDNGMGNGYYQLHAYHLTLGPDVLRGIAKLIENWGTA